METFSKLTKMKMTGLDTVGGWMLFGLALGVSIIGATAIVLFSGFYKNYKYSGKAKPAALRLIVLSGVLAAILIIFGWFKLLIYIGDNHSTSERDKVFNTATVTTDDTVYKNVILSEDKGYMILRGDKNIRIPGKAKVTDLKKQDVFKNKEEITPIE